MALLQIKYLKKKRRSKFSTKNQQLFIHLLADLLGNGFTVQESLSFMQTVRVLPDQMLDHFVNCMEKGNSLMEGMTQTGFQQLIVNQIELAYIHGNLAKTLNKIKNHMNIVEKQKTHLYKMISYPLVLLGFVTVILISIRQVLLPQLLSNQTIKSGNIGTAFIQYSPHYLLLFLISTSFLCIFIFLKLKKQCAWKKAHFFARIPIIGSLYKIYMTAFFAHE